MVLSSFYFQVNNEQRAIKATVLGVCALFEPNKECNYNHCRMALQILKDQYNIATMVSVTDDLLFY